MKSKDNVLSEVNLMMICYNIKRLTSILDLETLKNRLKNLYLNNIKLIDSFLAFLSPVNYFTLFTNLKIYSGF